MGNEKADLAAKKKAEKGGKLTERWKLPCIYQEKYTGNAVKWYHEVA